MRYQIRAWYVDTRPEGERNKSGLEKAKGSAIVEGSIVDALNTALKAAKGMSDEDGEVGRVEIRIPPAETAEANPFAR